MHLYGGDYVDLTLDSGGILEQAAVAGGAAAYIAEGVFGERVVIMPNAVTHMSIHTAEAVQRSNEDEALYREESWRG